MAQKILITGGLGYIGSHTAVVLAKLGYEIVLYDNLSNTTKVVLASLEKILGCSVPFCLGDVRDTNLLKNIISLYQIDLVIHFAGLKAVGESIQRPIDYYSSNVQGTISLLQALESQNVFNLIFSSSATVYGDPLYLPVDEAHPQNPLNPYGRTKNQAEEICKDLTVSNSKFRIVSLRYFNPVGCHNSGLIGEWPKGTPNNLMPFIAQVAIGLHDNLKIFGADYPTNDGTGVRDYIHVMDLAEGHAAALEFLERNTGYHVINLGIGKGYSVLEIIRAFESISRQKIKYTFASRRLGDIAESYSNPNKALELLNWKAKRTLEEVCASTYKFYRSIKFK